MHEDFADAPSKFKRDGKRAHEYMGWGKGDSTLPEEGTVKKIGLPVLEEEE